MSKPLSGNDARMCFWEHLDILRATLIWIVVVSFQCSGIHSAPRLPAYMAAV